MDVQTLLSQAIKASGETSLRGFAAKIGVTHQAVANWRDGVAVPTFEQAAELALLAGLDPVRTAAQVRMESKDGAKHRALLRRLAHAAAIAVLAVLPFASKAAPVKLNHFTPYALCEMVAARFVRFVRTFVTDRRHGTPALLA